MILILIDGLLTHTDCVCKALLADAALLPKYSGKKNNIVAFTFATKCYDASPCMAARLSMSLCSFKTA